MIEEFFLQDDRLGIPIPCTEKCWEKLNSMTRQTVLYEWENIRGQIPDRIAELEMQINRKQAKLEEEYNFKRCCQLNSEIAELASIINDLWIWYRKHEDMSSSKLEH